MFLALNEVEIAGLVDKLDIVLGYTFLEIVSNLVLGEVDLVIEDKHSVDIEVELEAPDMVVVEEQLLEGKIGVLLEVFGLLFFSFSSN